MRILIAAASIVATLSFPARVSATEVNLSTGLDGAGTLQIATDALDANWKVTGANNPQDAPNAYVVGDYAPDSGDPYWGPNGPVSSWIAANPNDPAGNGLMTFTRTFDVTDPSTAQIINGLWAIDDAGLLLLNNNVVAVLGSDRPTKCPGYVLCAFSTIPSDFVNGLNTLTIQIASTDNWVEGTRLQGEFVEGAIPTIPEPSTWTAMLVGFWALGLIAYWGSRENFRARATLGTNGVEVG